MRGKAFSLKSELDRAFSDGVIGKIERARAVLTIGIKLEDITRDIDDPSLEQKMTLFINKLKERS